MPCVEGKAYFGGRFLDLALNFNERIESLRLASQPGCRRVDFILPGFIDLHVHMRGLRQRHKGDWSSESLAALHGGVTVVADMPNNDPPIDSEDRLRMKLEEALRESYVDFVLYTMAPFLTDDPSVLGVKVYPQHLYDPRPFQLASSLGKEVVVHAEDPSALKQGPRVERPEDHWKARPRKAEILAVKRVLEVSSLYGSDLRIAHVSLPESVRMGIGKARFEVTPHHLFFNKDSVKGPLAKVNPPLRLKEDSEGLMSLVERGAIQFLVTDHAPHSREEKSRDYSEMPPGIPWLDVMAPFLLLKVKEGAPIQLLDMYSVRPALHMGVPRGSLAPGNLADVVILRREEWIVNEGSLYTKAGDSLLMGKTLPYKVEEVYLRGKLVFNEGPVDGPSGRALEVKRKRKGGSVLQQ